MDTTTTTAISTEATATKPALVMCPRHRAFEADYCPVCGTTILISER